MLSTPPRPRRWNCSEVGAFCGTTPQKPAGSACAAEADTAKNAIEASASVQARRILLMYSLLFDIGSARLGRDGSAGALTALPVVVGTDRDRRKDHDRDQNRYQRRGGRFGPRRVRLVFAESDRLAVADGSFCRPLAPPRLAAFAPRPLAPLAGVGAVAHARAVAPGAVSTGRIGDAGTGAAVRAARMTPASGTLFAGDGWDFRSVDGAGRFFGLGEYRKASHCQQSKH